MRYSISLFHSYEDSIITQADGDMGDGLQRTAFYYIGVHFLGDPDPARFRKAISLLHAPDVIPNANFIPIRDPVRWTDPHDISRDQEDPWLIALYFYNEEERLRFLIFRRWRRLGLYSNLDCSGPVQLANDLRLLKWRWSYPLVWILDLGYVIGAVQDLIWGRLARGRDGSWLDIDNALTRLVFTHHVRPTLFSRIAVWIYATAFPRTPAGKGVISALAWKHRAEAGANPAMAELWAEVWNATVSPSRWPTFVRIWKR